MMLLQKNGKMTTSDILQSLRDIFHPEGHDSDIISGRKDDYFSQKIRNIKCHSSLSDYVDYNKDDGWQLNETGRNFLYNIQYVVEEIDGIVTNQTFDYFDKITFIDLAVLPFFPRKRSSRPICKPKKVKKVIFYDENISEGRSSAKTILVRERSKKLREKAIEFFTDSDGVIKCCICGYEFGKTFGDYGKGYIEIHHKKPVYQYDDKDVESVLSEAINNLAPVCANCHRMLHHKKGVAFDEIKKIFNDNKEEDT
jgi:5-methylcytosine-specific restriction endonuclease McrA